MAALIPATPVPTIKIMAELLFGKFKSVSKTKIPMSNVLMVKKMLDFLEEDVYPWDVSSIGLRGITAKAWVRIKEDAIVCGTSIVSAFLRQMGLSKLKEVQEGTRARAGQVVMEYEGDAELILTTERVILNVVSKMSGIATATRTLVDKATSVNPRVRIAGTRKTTPGFRIFEKYAIQVGGGDPHRFNLGDAVLIKDNHIALHGSLEEAVKSVKGKVSFTKRIEVEVTTLEQAKRAFSLGVDAILLDNMSPKEVEEVVRDLGGRVILEASGRINPDNVVDYARTGVDIISSGYITHSSRSIDYSLDVERI
jgi:nicotinate-nucleotide pyrophosphorylase (carboxylating)